MMIDPVRECGRMDGGLVVFPLSSQEARDSYVAVLFIVI